VLSVAEIHGNVKNLTVAPLYEFLRYQSSLFCKCKARHCSSSHPDKCVVHPISSPLTKKNWRRYWFCTIFTARRNVVQSAVVRSHVVRLSACPSVCLSVTLVDQDHIGGKSWKLTARTLSTTPSLFVAQRPSTYSQGNMGKFSGDYRWDGKDPDELDSCPTL